MTYKPGYGSIKQIYCLIRVKHNFFVLRRPRKPRLKEWEMDYEFYIGDGLVRGVDWDRTPSSGEIACGQCER
jgi:hypothetical protein